jgi:glyoxylase I family protein
MEPLGVHHVSVNVADVEAALEFYVGALGFRLRGDRPDFGVGGAWLDVGAQQVHLVEGRVPDALGQHFAVRVGDLDHVVLELRGRGLEVSDPMSVGANRQAFVDDPFGNTVELHQIGGRPA